MRNAATNTVRFDMMAWQIVPWAVLREDARYLETLDIGTLWLGAFQDFVGQYREVGVQRFIFCFGSAAVPPPYYTGLVASGAWAGRDALDAFAAQAMKDMQEIPDQSR